MVSAFYNAETIAACRRAGVYFSVTARLIVRRVRRLGRPGQDELLPAWRYHAVFTDSPLRMLDAEASHRDHAVIEQLNADLIDGPLAHLPSGNVAANAAWLACAALAHNLTRAAGALASTFHGKARGATLRRELINLAGRLAHHGRDQLVLHLPEPGHFVWTNLFEATHRARQPAAAAA